MKKSALVVAIVLSLVLWLLLFKFFFAFNRLWLSLAVIALSVVITYFVLKALTKRGEDSPSVLAQVIVPIVITVAAMFGASLGIQATCKETAQAIAQCGPARIAPDYDCLKKKIEWTIVAPTGTKIRIHDFKKIDQFGNETPDQPLELDPDEGVNTNVLEGKVKVDKDGYFKYSVTCTDSSGQKDTNDPMIEIPPRGR